MARVKIKFPDEKSLFKLSIPVRIADINYGGHVGNDAILSIIHEARMQFLARKGYDELSIGGHGLIMADVMIAYKGEAFYGDVLNVSLYVDELTDFSFDLLYDITTLRNGSETNIAQAKTGMVCFNYTDRKIVSMSNELKSLLKGVDF
jgi:acyl-CoA thioesterase FadM